MYNHRHHRDYLHVRHS